MASGLLDASKINKGKSQWGENNKVYTRRFKKKHQTLLTDHANPVPDGSVEPQQPVGNGVVKPAVVVSNGRVKIHLKAANKDELVELTETMKSELEHVRRVAQKLQDKEAELTALVRVNSEVGLVTNGNVRPFRQLSVSVAKIKNNVNGVSELVEKEKRTPKANPYYQSSEFLLGKDRLPSESNKRHKSNSGTGRKNSKESYYVRTFKSCNHLLQRLMKHKFGWVFNEPVNAKMLGLHDYHDIIKHPMDLGTVKSRLAQNFYKSPMEFADDVRLTFRNAMIYNPKGQDVHFMADQLLNLFEERWSVIESECNPNSIYGMLYDPRTPTPTSRKAPHFAHPPSRMLYRSESMSVPVLTRQNPPTRTPVQKKPKAKDLNKRNMTYEEKQKLSTNLQSLPSEKLDNIVQIIKKNASVSQHDDEIEVDIDSVDVETLWELDRFVTNYRKNLSKHKRKAALAQQARAEGAGDVNQTMNQAKSIPEVPKEDKITEANTLAGGPVNQGESSSSSSSSDSGSSSSDSDSDSSSEYGSDAAGHSPRS